MKTKKIPMRMCTGCGEMFDKRELRLTLRVKKPAEVHTFAKMPIV